MLNEAQVPVLVFSAGIGDILEEILLMHDAYFPNIKIVSNYMDFNEKGALIGFKKPIIHTFNKNETVLGESKEYFADLSHRQNAILLGDSDGDIHMGAGMENPGAILKIGFLNSKVSVFRVPCISFRCNCSCKPPFATSLYVLSFVSNVKIA